MTHHVLTSRTYEDLVHMSDGDRLEGSQMWPTFTTGKVVVHVR